MSSSDSLACLFVQHELLWVCLYVGGGVGVGRIPLCLAARPCNAAAAIFINGDFCFLPSSETDSK